MFADDPLNAPDPNLLRMAQIGRCVDGVTHDVNNYLGAAQAYTELVSLETGLSNENRRMLNEVITSIARCSSLISTLTAIARKGRGHINIVEPLTLIREVAALFDYTCRARRIPLTLDLPETAPSVLGDTQHLQLALVYAFWYTLDLLELKESKDAITVSLLPTDQHLEMHLACAVLAPLPPQNLQDHTAALLPQMTELLAVHGGGVSLEAGLLRLSISHRPQP